MGTGVGLEQERRRAEEDGAGGPEVERSVNCLVRLASEGAETTLVIVGSGWTCTVFFCFSSIDVTALIVSLIRAFPLLGAVVGGGV